MKLSKKTIIFSIAIVIVAAGAALAAYLLLMPKQDQRANEQQGTTPVLQKYPSEEKADSADKLAFEGNIAGGVQLLDDAIKTTSDSTELLVYYSRKATLLFNNNQLDEALVAAKKADEIAQSSDSAAFVGQIARKKGNAAEAIEYYKKAVTKVSENDPLADEDVAYYQEIVAELEAR